MSAAVDTARALVQLASVNPNYNPRSPGEGAVAAWIGNWAKEQVFEASTEEVLPGRSNVVLKLENGASHPHVLFAGHTDTVAVDGMTIPPFEAAVRDGRLFGRGSADMKGPLAAMLHALPALREKKDEWRGTVSVACVVDEEYVARGIKALMKEGVSPYDFGIVGEPTRLRVVRGCKGCLRFNFEAIGLSAHSSMPERGRSAIIAMSEAVLALDDFFKSELSAVRRAGFGSSTGSVGLIQGGSGTNIVPESCRASVDIRLLPGQRWEDVYDAFQRRVRQSSSRVPGIEWKFGGDLFADPPFENNEGSPLVQAALGLLAQENAEVVFYCCDASKISAAGVPCIVLGPGDIAEAHTARESIEIAEIDRAVGVYAGLARRLMPVP